MSLLTEQKYFIAGHTADGFVNYLDSNVAGIAHIFALKHASHIYQTHILKQLIARFSPQYDLEVLLSPFGEAYLEGVIVRELSCAVITDRLTLAEMSFTPIELEEKSPADHLVIYRQTQQLYDLAYKHFAQGLAIHDTLEKIYIDEMDFKKADDITASFINDLLENAQPKNSDHTQQFHRLLGTNTATGSVNIVPHLIKDMSQRVYIKGRAGTGKSVFMKKVAQACAEKGFDLELYHCSFDPDSIDMVIVRELGFCIFDSTDPHAFSPERESDMLIDLYKDTVTLGTDEKFAREIWDVSQQYKAELKKGTQCLQQAANNQEMIEQHYKPLNEKEISRIAEHILQLIKQA